MRTELEVFAELMEQQLQDNAHKGGWKDAHPMCLMKKIDEHTALLRSELEVNNWDVEKIALSIANYAMMMVDVTSGLHREEPLTWPDNDPTYVGRVL